jgi:hypothetical protein
MANILKLSNAGGVKSLVRYYDMLAGNIVNWSPTSGYDALSTVTVPSGGSASITFTGIPQIYTHLQIRYIARANAAVAGFLLWFNSDTSANYSGHYLEADGSSVVSGGFVSSTPPFIAYCAPSSSGSNIFGTGVIDILDYANTNKNKTIRSLTGEDNNGSGYTGLISSSWRNTATVNTISLQPQSTNSFVQYTSFALYGIKGA